MTETALVPRAIEALEITEFRARMEFEKERIAAMKEFVSGQMTEGVHFGKIPGTGGKKTLLKPGAELLTNIHGLHPEFEETERVCDRDAVKHWTKRDGEGDCRGYFKYSFRCSLYRNGLKVGEGVGTCNNWEKKYLTVDPDDAENTIMKMGKKRAFIDAVLTATRTSDFFTQDMEDVAPAAEPVPDGGQEIPATVRPTTPPPQESHSTSEAVISDKQRSRLWAITYAAATRRGTDKKEATKRLREILSEHNIEASEDVPESRYDYIVKRIEDWGYGK